MQLRRRGRTRTTLNETRKGFVEEETKKEDLASEQERGKPRYEVRKGKEFHLVVKKQNILTTSH